MLGDFVRIYIYITLSVHLFHLVYFDRRLLFVVIVVDNLNAYNKLIADNSLNFRFRSNMTDVGVKFVCQLIMIKDMSSSKKIIIKGP